MRRGVVYACSHQRWLAETLVSAESCRRHMPELEREIYLTAPLCEAAGTDLDRHFTRVIVLEGSEHPARPRFDSVVRTTLDQALFIDGDTLFLAPVHELFELLDDFDIALAAAPQYLSPKARRLGIYEMLPPVSLAQPEWNTGVLVARMDGAFREMSKTWSGLYATTRSKGFAMDQAAMRSALVHSRLRVATLPNNYNLRALLPQLIAGDVKILHAHGDLKKIAGYINKGDPLGPVDSYRSQMMAPTRNSMAM